MEDRLLEASFAELMLETLGFEEMANGSIIDNSTGNLIIMNGKELKAMSISGERPTQPGITEFNPLRNIHLSQKLLVYLINRRQKELPLVITTFYPILDKTSGKKRYDLRYCLLENGIKQPERTITSNAYKNDTLCIYEIMKMLCGEALEETYEDYDYN